MALFGRKRTDTTTLPEIDRYYQGERRDRAGLAWLLALISILCVVAVVIGLFFGGRWLYRNLTKDDTKHPVAVQTTNNTQNSTDQSTPATGTDKQIGDNQTSASNNLSSSSSNSSSSQTPTSTPPQTSSTSTTTPSTPSTAPTQTTKQLVNTGAESVIPAFMIAAFLGVLIYRAKAVRD